jgi:hypothetical protein
MAIDKILHVLNHSKAKKSHKLVLLEIANHINKDGLAWPSQQRLAGITGLTRRWIVQIVSDLQAVGELDVIPGGGPHGELAYRIPGSELTSHRMKSSGELSSISPVNSLHTESVYSEPIQCKNCSEDEERWRTHDEAVELGLTPGTKLYRKATGELLPGE